MTTTTAEITTTTLPPTTTIPPTTTTVAMATVPDAVALDRQTGVGGRGDNPAQAGRVQLHIRLSVQGPGGNCGEILSQNPPAGTTAPNRHHGRAYRGVVLKGGQAATSVHRDVGVALWYESPLRHPV